MTYNTVLLILYIVFSFYDPLYAKNGLLTQQLTTIEQLKEFLAKENNHVTLVMENVLVLPYNKLLTQPLMTKAISNHYQRTPIIQSIYAIKNSNNNTYYRVIEMLIDPNKKRNNPKKALNKKEAVVVELAFITMNFKALPEQVSSAVINTNIPFGKLLMMNQIKVITKNRQYFTLNCNHTLANLLQCTRKTKLFGRTNTIIRADNNQWIAKVIEILPGEIDLEANKGSD